MKHTPPPLVFPASAVLSIRKTEKLSDGVTFLGVTLGKDEKGARERMFEKVVGEMEKRF